MDGGDRRFLDAKGGDALGVERGGHEAGGEYKSVDGTAWAHGRSVARWRRAGKSATPARWATDDVFAVDAA